MAGLRILINKFTSAHCHHLVFMRLTWAVNCAPRVSPECLGGWCWFFRHFVDFFFFKKKTKTRGTYFRAKQDSLRFLGRVYRLASQLWRQHHSGVRIKINDRVGPDKCWSLPRLLSLGSSLPVPLRQAPREGVAFLDAAEGFVGHFSCGQCVFLALIDADDTALDNELITNKSVAMRTRRRWRTQLASDAN